MLAAVLVAVTLSAAAPGDDQLVPYRMVEAPSRNRLPLNPATRNAGVALSSIGTEAKVEGLHRVLDRYRARPILTAPQIEDVIAYLLTLTDSLLPHDGYNPRA